MSKSEPLGCLAVFLKLFGIHSSHEAPQLRLPYRIRDDFISPAELSFYHVLKQAVRDQVTISPKVNLNDLFYVPRRNEDYRYRSKINRKHVDFLLCDNRTMQPRCGIELDDSSHRRADRQRRDLFVDEVFRSAGLPLVHITARATYDAKQLAAELAPFLTPPVIAPPLPAVSLSARTPLCPKCDVPMVLRVASRGSNTGQQFWGCPNYPRCRELIPST